MLQVLLHQRLRRAGIGLQQGIDDGGMFLPGAGMQGAIRKLGDGQGCQGHQAAEEAGQGSVVGDLCQSQVKLP